MRNQRMVYFWLLLVPAFVLSACNLSAETDPASGVTIQEREPTPVQNTPSSDLAETYVDDVLGFAVDYPAGWRVDARPGELIQIFSPVPADYTPEPRNQDSFPADQTKFEFIPQHTGDTRSIEQVITDMQSPDNPSPSSVESAEPITLPQGLAGYRMKWTGGTEGLILTINERIVYITAYGDVTRFDEVMNTLRINS